MPGNEWSLVIFTLLSQAGVGILLAGELTKIITNKKTGSNNVLPLAVKTRITALIFASLGLAISFFHLGNPSKAVYSLSNLKSSWLSREILAAIFFLVFLFTSVSLGRWKKSSHTAVKIFVAAAVCTGIFLILSMSILYMLPGVITWNFITTPLSFFATAFLLGFMITAILSLKTENTESIPASSEQAMEFSVNPNPVRIVINITFILASIQILLSIILSLRLHNLNSFYSPFESTLLQEHRIFLYLRIVFMLAGMALIFLSLAKSKPGKKSFKIPILLFYTAFTVILLSEILGRTLFYPLFYRFGL